MVDLDDDEDIDIEQWTTSLGFALAQMKLVSYSQTLFYLTPLANYASYLVCWRYEFLVRK